MSDSGKNKQYERFGRYLILDHFVDGGMAKICRARFLGEQADKIVAIKMVQPQFSKDESFKIMFMNEIKVTFGLLHPNIVQTYDYGFHKDQLFVAMEYCDGRNLKEYLDKLKQRKFVFPVEISVYIITQVCQGLNYSHNFTDKLTGKKSNIVHRDISPHNIMLTFDGAVKIIDFGIAKAETNSEKTQAGTIKGKLSYLAPEYLDGKDLDPRYDEFAVGITLWEMLCSRKLFKASNDLAVLKKIQECKIPAPSSINPNVPKELDEIVLKALSKNRNDRYGNMDQLNRALIKFLYATYPDFNATDLSYFAKELFKDEIKLDRQKLFEFGKIDLSPYLNQLRFEKNGGAGDADPEVELKRKEVNVLDFGFEEKSITLKHDVSKNDDKKEALSAKTTEGPSDGQRFNKTLKTKKPSKLTEGDSDNKQSGEKTRNPTRVGNSKTKIVELKKKKRSGTHTSIRELPQKKESGSKKFFTAIALIAFIVGVTYFKGSSLLGINSNDGEERAANKVVDKKVDGAKDRQPSAFEDDSTGIEKMGKILLKDLDKLNHKVFIDGNRVEPNYLRMVDVPVERDFVLRVEMPGRKHFVVKNLQLTDGEKREVHIKEQGFASYGYLEMSRACIKGTLLFELFGEKRREELPIISERGAIPFPVSVNEEGDSSSKVYEAIYLISGDGIERKIKFEISEDKMTDLCESEGISQE